MFTFVLLSEKDVSSAEVQLARDKVTNGEWGSRNTALSLFCKPQCLRAISE